MSAQQQSEEGQAFDAWSQAHQFRYEDRRGTRLVVARGCMRERVEDVEVYFSTKSRDGSLPFLPLAQVEALRDRLTEIVEETRRGPVGVVDGEQR